ncbi:MAG: hypothetical protein ACK5O3_13765 [Burkholderiales bacterium]|jgi:hypothetical protein
MHIPNYWAEGRAQRRDTRSSTGHGSRRQLTVRRWGWSDQSQEAAQAHADQRAADALETLWKQSDPDGRREPRVAYNGAEGVPIREQVLDRVGEQVITRNGYGAECLNSPSLFIADIDAPDGSLSFVAYALGALLAVGAWAWLQQLGFGGLGVLLGIALLLLWLALAGDLWHRMRGGAAGARERCLQRIRRFSKERPSWRLRLYETPAGLRVLATHAPLDPISKDVATAFEHLGTDPIYARMCLRQACFRARLTGKPWRMGMSSSAPARGVAWPLNDRQAALRGAWLTQYEALSAGFAACRFLEELGEGNSDPSLQDAVALHDTRSRALSPLPLA